MKEIIHWQFVQKNEIAFMMCKVSHYDVEVSNANFSKDLINVSNCDKKVRIQEF